MSFVNFVISSDLSTEALELPSDRTRLRSSKSETRDPLPSLTSLMNEDDSSIVSAMSKWSSYSES